MEHICDINNVGLKDTSGFKMLNGYSLLVHYKKKKEQNSLTNQRIQRLLEEGYKLVCLPEETSLVVEDRKCYIIGSKPAEIILKNQSKIATKIRYWFCDYDAKINENIFMFWCKNVA